MHSNNIIPVVESYNPVEILIRKYRSLFNAEAFYFLYCIGDVSNYLSISF
jgi:hypothetical protein